MTKPSIEEWIKRFHHLYDDKDCGGLESPQEDEIASFLREALTQSRQEVIEEVLGIAVDMQAGGTFSYEAFYRRILQSIKNIK